MNFFFKKRFFINAAIGFIAFYGWSLWDLYNNPNEAYAILWGAFIGTLLYFAIVGIPWFLAVHSHIASGRENLKELRGGIEYLLEKRRALLTSEDSLSRTQIQALDQKLEEAAALYNQSIEDMDRALGEYPNRFFVEKIFGYRRPKPCVLSLPIPENIKT
ncbi:MAG: hypothetical protein KDJ75_03070 [Alphaproteobacteria bacterium]|nr:hypothetical protein [Alphaproteobacteria bacterium]